ncbi:MAG TPA: hypothetical protein VH518_19255, partial [Tepidisphaeraceae bacterium]
LFTRNNDFPVEYHPDESGKAIQIMSDSQQRNFKHPLLMLEAANLMKQWTFGPDDPRGADMREVVIVGRRTSALIASIGVFALALAGWAAYGLPGLVIGGLTMALCPPLVVYAHYFKEDASLAGGIMLAILGARLVISSKSELTQLLSALVLGVGCGVAMSGKYVGAGTIVPALFTLLIARKLTSWWSIPTRIAVFAIAVTGTVITINYRAFVDWTSLQVSAQAESNLQAEVEHGQQGHSGLRLPAPNPWCLTIARSEMMPHIWAFMAVGLVWLAFRRQFGRWGFVLLAFLLTFSFELSYNAIPFARYALPITLCAYFVASQMASYVVHDLWQKRAVWGAAAMGVCAVVILLTQGSRAANFNEQFRDDSRQRVREWIAKNLPPAALITCDSYASLHTEGDPWRFPQQSPLTQRIQVNGFFAADAGETPQDLANSGTEYVVAAWSSYDRFFEPGIEGMPGDETWLERHRKFYEELFSKGKLVWSSVPSPSTHSYTNMEIRVYQISQLANQPGDNGSGSKPGVGGLLRNLFR